MKLLIVYDSLFGNTKKIAESIKSGFEGKFDTKMIHAKDAEAQHVEGIDMLIVGTPTHAGNYSKTVKKFVNSLPEKALKGIKVGAFDTSIPQEGQGTFVKFIIRVFKNAAPRLLKVLTAKGGEKLGFEIFWVLDREGPLKEGEIERTQKWAEELIEKING